MVAVSGAVVSKQGGAAGGGAETRCRNTRQVAQLYGEAEQLQREGATLRERERAAAGEGAGEGARVLELLETARAERDVEAARAAQLFSEAEALQRQLAELRDRDRARQGELRREIAAEATPGRTASTPAARAPAAAGGEAGGGGASAVRAALGLPPAPAPAAAEAEAAASGGGSGEGLQVRALAMRLRVLLASPPYAV